MYATNTYQAYNNWGGKSLYEFNSTGGRATKVSYNRPYAVTLYNTQLDREKSSRMQSRCLSDHRTTPYG